MSSPEGTPLAVLFTDIVGSTRYFARYGDQAGLRLVERHNRVLFPLIEATEGRVVKTLGDGVLAVFHEPASAIRVGIAVQKALAALRSTEPPDEQFQVRVGIHFGLVIEKAGDIFGDVVNLTDRVKSAGQPDQVLVSRTLREMVKNDPRFVLESIGLKELKGAPDPMEIFVVAQAPDLRPLTWRGTVARRIRRKRRAISLGGLVLVAVAAALFAWSRTRAPLPPAIAVLPFRNATGDAEIEYLRTALAEELNVQLRSVGDLQVRPLSAVKGLQPGSWDQKKLLDEVKVDRIIEGSLWRSQDTLRLTVAIVDVRENRQLWAETFEERLSDLLALLSRVTRRITAALRVRVEDRPGTQNAQAYDRFLRGVAFLLEVQREKCDSAIQALEEATRLDPEFARAHAALARALATKYWWNFSNDHIWLERAEASARRALELDPTSAEGHYALAYAVECVGRRAECVSESLASYRADPDYVPAILNLARYSFYMGEIETALYFLDRMAQLDPTQNIRIRKAIYLFFAGRREESLAEAKAAEARAMGVDELTLLGVAYIWLGELESAERLLTELRRTSPGALSIAEMEAWLFTARGQIPEARAAMERISQRESWGIAQGMAAMYALQGDKEKSLEWLRRAVERGAPSYVWFVSAHYAVLRDNPEYQAIVARLDEEYAPARETLRKLR